MKFRKKFDPQVQTSFQTISYVSFQILCEPGFFLIWKFRFFEKIPYGLFTFSKNLKYTLYICKLINVLGVLCHVMLKFFTIFRVTLYIFMLIRLFCHVWGNNFHNFQSYPVYFHINLFVVSQVLLNKFHNFQNNPVNFHVNSFILCCMSQLPNLPCIFSC